MTQKIEMSPETIWFSETANARNVDLKRQMPVEGRLRMQAFCQTGFAREILASKDEDVWSD